MSLFRAAASALVVLALSTAASAATILPATGTTTVQLLDLGIPVSALPGTIDNGGGSFSFPVTGYITDASGTTLFHDGSGLQVASLTLRDFRYTLGNPLSFPITLFGDVDGVANDLPLFEVDDEMGALELSLTPVSAGALGLASPIAIGNVTGIEYEPSQVPEPASLLLLGSALAVAARRLRR